MLQNKKQEIEKERIQEFRSQEFRSQSLRFWRIKRMERRRLKKNNQLKPKQISQKKQIKSAEKQRIAAEVRKTKLTQQYMNANKAMIQMKAWKSQQDGLEREIKIQNEKLIVQGGIKSVNLKEMKILEEQAKRLIKTKVDFNQAYDKELKTAYQMNKEPLRRSLKQNLNVQYSKGREGREYQKYDQKK
ncbi:unnamed protein product [Paramecium octaurelia]|uniref:Uncharacterized protein n=1 Tax=Paramecium octaurelia TaxID=43137 RepID=A0A8S1WMJ4_PAROT|nr:unnamed protein product [Paramecium octaurelia]